MHAATNKTSLFTSLLLALILACLSGCATVQTQVVGNEGLKNYKRAHVEALTKDEFQLYGALVIELADMGMQVVATPLKEPEDTDLIVKYTYEAGWDMSRYLQSFQLQFIDAKTSRVVAMQSFRSVGIWLGVRDRRLKAAFNELRARNGYPPSKQFP